MTDNKYFKAFTRVFAITLALIMVLGAVMTQTVSAFSGKVGSKYTVQRSCTMDREKVATAMQLSAISEMISEAAFPSACSRIKTHLYGQEIRPGPCR